MVLVDFGNGQKTYRHHSTLHQLQTAESIPPHVRVILNGRYQSGENDVILATLDRLTLTVTLSGGKGGFGSMLRSIGAQIEATTNNDACRDLSGKRLRDVKCEKLLKEWAEKKAKEKDDRRERKKQRIERILEGPSKIKAQDNTYISEMRSMSETVETAIACAIAEDPVVRQVKLPAQPKPRKWLGDDDEDSESEDEAGPSGEPDQGSLINEGQRESSEEQRESSEGPGESSEGHMSEEGNSAESDPERMETERTESVVTEPAMEAEASPTADDSAKNTESSPAADTTPTTTETTPPPTISSPPAETTPPSTTSSETTAEEPPAPLPEWRHLTSPSDLLESLGADTLKRVLSELGMKCGGTPAARAERLFEVRDLSQEEIPAELRAGGGRKRKPKNA